MGKSKYVRLSSRMSVNETHNSSDRKNRAGFRNSRCYCQNSAKSSLPVDVN
jgi:hypothetical protein